MKVLPRRMNIWEGKDMKKKSNLLLDGYLGLAPGELYRNL